MKAKKDRPKLTSASIKRAAPVGSLAELFRPTMPPPAAAVDAGRAAMGELLRSGVDFRFAIAALCRPGQAVESLARLHGGLLAAFDVLDQAQAAGADVRCEDQSRVHPLLGLAFRVRGTSARLALLQQLPAAETAMAFQAVLGVAAVFAPWLAQRERLQDPAPPAPPVPTAPPVSLQITWPTGPMPVAIQSVPMTVATSEVLRDSSGRITTTVVTTEARKAA